MLKKILLLILAVLGAAVLLGASGLTWAHLAIRRERRRCRRRSRCGRAGADGPCACPSSTRPASRCRARRCSIRARSRSRRAAYVMSHPSFVLEWADGRILLIDDGMNARGGAGVREATGAGSAAPADATARRARPSGSGGGGAGAGCRLHPSAQRPRRRHRGALRARRASHRVFMTQPQARAGPTTRPGRACV